MPDNETSPLSELLSLAVENNASDVHVKEGAPALLRVSGELVQTEIPGNREFFDELKSYVITDQKKAALYEKTGNLDDALPFGDAGRFRVNLHRQNGGDALTLRYVKSRIPVFDKMNLPPILKSIAGYKNGLVLLCGTTGSGKSTTLAAMLQYLNETVSKHIITIEDPVEYLYTDQYCFFEQRQVGIDTDSFYGALTGAMRQDPDIIMIGEMRDRETFEAAMTAADTGHLVFSTLHASTAWQTVTRILDMFPKAEQDSIRNSLALNLSAVIAQRLMPLTPGPGVIPACEIMINNSTVRKLLMENRISTLQTAIETGGADGMQSFNQSILAHLQNGKITEETAFLYSDDPNALAMNMKGITRGSDSSRILG